LTCCSVCVASRFHCYKPAPHPTGGLRTRQLCCLTKTPNVKSCIGGGCHAARPIVHLLLILSRASACVGRPLCRLPGTGSQFILVCLLSSPPPREITRVRGGPFHSPTLCRARDCCWTSEGCLSVHDASSAVTKKHSDSVAASREVPPPKNTDKQACAPTNNERTNKRTEDKVSESVVENGRTDGRTDRHNAQNEQNDHSTTQTTRTDRQTKASCGKERRSQRLTQ